MSVDLHIDDQLIAKAIEAGHHETAEEAVTTPSKSTSALTKVQSTSPEMLKPANA